MLPPAWKGGAMQSYTRGPKGTVVRKTIGEAFLETADRCADRVALISRHQNIRLTWAQYAHEAQRVAAGLRGLGLRPGDRVGVWATNCAEWPIIQFGCALAGVVLVNVNPASRSHELSFVLRKSRMRALFLHAQGRHSNYTSILEQSRAGQVLALEHVIHLDSEQWEKFLRDPNGITARPDPDEPANIQYTSGTTGQPKGVLLTHVNLVNNARFFAEYMRVTEEDRACVPVPMFHCFGSVIGTMTAAVSGSACIFPAATFDPLATLEAIDAERATVIYGVPTMFIAELQHPEFARFQLTSLRTGIMAFKISANAIIPGGSSSATETKKGNFELTSPGRFDRANCVAASGCARPGPPGPRPVGGVAAAPPPGCPHGANPPWPAGGVAGKMLNPGADMKTTPFTPTPEGP
jgi:fatty-acyl-CoA synthase